MVPQHAPRNPLALSLAVPVPRLLSRVSRIIQMRKVLEPPLELARGVYPPIGHAEAPDSRHESPVGSVTISETLSVQCEPCAGLGISPRLVRVSQFVRNNWGKERGKCLVSVWCCLAQFHPV